MTRIVVGTATCGVAAGAGKTLERLTELSKGNEGIAVSQTGCIGMCYQEPIIEVIKDDKKFLYGGVNEKVAELIFNKHIIENEPQEKFLLNRTEGKYSFDHQTRVVLRNAGIIDPENIDEYLAQGGYEGIKKSLSMTPEQVVETIIESGLRGRGGGGFPTGRKWQLAAAEKNDKKYVICNADEGDPGAFMDRSVLEGDPHSVLEGIMICGYAMGADEAYIYCRAEYPLAVKRLKDAIEQAKAKNLMGEKIMASGFSFEIHVKEGAGAFVCGEETALIGSIEGKRGMPRIRPPFPAQSGLWKKPSNVNNVETFAAASWIMANGAEAYNRYGAPNAKGTKVFALAGKIKHGGLVEVELGIPLRQIIFDVGGGILNDKEFKAVQMGGPSGGCLPADLLDTPVEYESLVATGAIVGSGGMVVLDETTCMVDVAKYFLSFTQEESCGKCTFCRIGTKRMLEIMERITEGEGEPADIDLLYDLAAKIKNSSLCGLGQTAPNPVLTTLKYFKDEYIAHIEQKRCPAGVCTSLISFKVDEEKCTGCTACKRACPVNAVSGEVKQLHKIDQELCIKCGACYTACRFDAIIRS